MIFARLVSYANSQKFRARCIGFGMACVFGFVAIKSGQLALGSEENKKVLYSAESERFERAEITDRNGELLATSVTVHSLYADPRAIWNPREIATQLSFVFDDLDIEALTKRLSNRKRAFEWVRRSLTPRQRNAVLNLGLEGLGFRKEIRRAYPKGTLAGHILGHTGLDGNGLDGIELVLNSRLKNNSDTVRLTLDSNVQFALEAELADAAERFNIKGGAGIVLNSKNGEIYGMASWPPIDPNRVALLDRDDPSRMNRAVTAVYEFGSVFKPFTVAAGLHSGRIALTDRFDVSQPEKVRNAEISDTHPIKSGIATTSDVVVKSSNIGSVQIAMKVGGNLQSKFLKSVGLTEKAPIELSGSARPLVPQRWNELVTATVSFGHGIAVSPLAFTTAFSVFANDGVYRSPSLLIENNKFKNRRVMSSETSQQMLTILRDVVRNGTGRRASVAGYRVAGKTGTAEKSGPNGYSEEIVVTSFAGIFPADDPEYVIFIVLDEPDELSSGKRTAGWNVAPVTAKLIARIAPILGITPNFENAENLNSKWNTDLKQRKAL